MARHRSHFDSGRQQQQQRAGWRVGIRGKRPVVATDGDLWQLNRSKTVGNSILDPIKSSDIIIVGNRSTSERSPHLGGTFRLKPRAPRAPAEVGWPTRSVFRTRGIQSDWLTEQLNLKG